MNGHIYSNMPDTTRRVSPYRRSVRRLVASTSLFVSSLLLAASMGLAQTNSDASCEDFDSPEAAMEYVASNPDAESSLDSDGDGTVCNEDPSLFAQSDDSTQKDEFAQVMRETTQDTTESTTEDTSEDTPADTEDSSGSPDTPDTGGMELLPLAGSMMTAMFGGFMLLRRR